MSRDTLPAAIKDYGHEELYVKKGSKHSFRGVKKGRGDCASTEPIWLYLVAL